MELKTNEEEQTEKAIKAFSDEEYKKFNYRRLEYFNALIGSYNSKCDYVITQNILKELVLVNKVIRDVHENRYYAIASSTKGSAFNLKFSVVIQTGQTEEMKMATLCFLEDVVNPNTGSSYLISTPIASYKDDKDAYFFTKVKKAFNLLQIDESEGKDIMDEKLVALYLEEKNRKIKIAKRMATGDEGIEEEYLKDLIKELKKMGKYGEWVLKNYLKLQNQLGEKFPQKGDPNYYRECARIMDQSISSARAFKLNQSEMATLGKIQQNRANQYDQLIKEAGRVEVFAPKPKFQEKPKAQVDSGSLKPKGTKSSPKSNGPSKSEDSKPKKNDKKKPATIIWPKDRTPIVEGDSAKVSPPTNPVKEKDKSKTTLESMLSDVYSIASEVEKSINSAINLEVLLGMAHAERIEMETKIKLDEMVASKKVKEESRLDISEKGIVEEGKEEKSFEMER